MADPPSIPALALALPPGRYLVAVSGGADSTALLRLLVEQRIDVVVAHLNHELRGQSSDGDAAFVRDLAARFSLPMVGERLSNIALPRLPKNDSARYRAARLALYRAAIAAHRLDAVLLAHHADDQAEGVLLRLLRGGQLPALGGMSDQATVSGVAIRRPLLGVRREELRDYLRSIDQPWREDASNASPDYRRNVVRGILSKNSELTAALLGLSAAAARLRSGLDGRSPYLPGSFEASALQLPAILAENAAGRWLIERGAPPDGVSPAARRRLIAQALDPASPGRQHYPGGLLVRRRKRWIDVVASPPVRRAGLQSADPNGQDQTAPAGEL